jgi:hypothetical protein
MVQRNNDLILMILLGVAFYYVNIYINAFPVEQQIYVGIAFSFFCGLFLSGYHQMVEWPLCFYFGGILSSAIPIAIQYTATQKLDLAILVSRFEATTLWYGIFLTSWIIGLPLGIFIQRLIMGSYWHRNSII